jgi:hypothetical protein
MSESTVPVSPETEARLARIAARTGLDINDILDEALSAYESRLFFAEMDETYAVLEADFQEWNAYMANLAAWIGPMDSETPEVRLEKNYQEAVHQDGRNEPQEENG